MSVKPSMRLKITIALMLIVCILALMMSHYTEHSKSAQIHYQNKSRHAVTRLIQLNDEQSTLIIESEAGVFRTTSVRNFSVSVNDAIYIVNADDASNTMLCQETLRNTSCKNVFRSEILSAEHAS